MFVLLLIVKPILFFAFANDKDAYLENLKDEEREIRNILLPLDKKGEIEFLSIGNTTADDIFRTFESYLDRIVLFHYGGHAGGTQLHLEDDIASTQGLAKLFGLAKHLQVVILNGCSTQGQVQKLFKAGVKSVVATSAPIDDKKAVLFATDFYRALAEHNTIEDSFDLAIAALQTHGNIKNKDISKEIDLQKDKEQEKPLWGIYTRTKSSLGWKVYEMVENPEVSSIPQKSANDFLMSIAFDAVNEYNPFPSGRKGNPAQLKLKKREHFVNSLPSIMGQQVSVLFNPEFKEKGKERLQQIKIVYYRIIRFISSIAISDLWEKVEKKPDLEIPNQLRYLFVRFLESNKDDSFHFPYLPLLDGIVKFLDSNTSFLEELSDAISTYSEKKDLFQAHHFFTELMKKDFNSLENTEAESLSNDGEYYLSLLVKHFAFLTGYFISSNKKILIHKIRFQKGLFKHELRVLYGNEFAEDETMSLRTDLLDSYSVYLVKQTEEEQEFLNLTPFIVDKNSFFDIETPDLYQFVYSDKVKFFYDHIIENSTNHDWELSTLKESNTDNPNIQELYEGIFSLFQLYKKHLGGES